MSPRSRQRSHFALVVHERPLQQRDVGQLEVVHRPLRLVGLVHVAVGDARHPLQVEHVVDALQVHGEPLGAVGELHAGRIEIDAAHLLEVGELGALHAVDPDFPAQTPGTQSGRLPVVLHEAHVVLGQVDAQMLERGQVEILDVVRAGLEDHLVLVVVTEPVGVLPVAAVGGTDRGLHIGHFPGIGPSTRKKVAGLKVPAPTSV